VFQNKLCTEIINRYGITDDQLKGYLVKLNDEKCFEVTGQLFNI